MPTLIELLLGQYGKKDPRLHEGESRGTEYLPPGQFSNPDAAPDLMAALRAAQADPQIAAESRALMGGREHDAAQAALARSIADLVASQSQAADRMSMAANLNPGRSTAGPEITLTSPPVSIPIPMPISVPPQAPGPSAPQYAHLDSPGRGFQSVGPTPRPQPQAPTAPRLPTPNATFDIPTMVRTNPTDTVYPMPRDPIINGGPFQTMAPPNPMQRPPLPEVLRQAPTMISAPQGPGGYVPPVVRPPPGYNPPQPQRPPNVMGPGAFTGANAPIGAGYGGGRSNPNPTPSGGPVNPVAPGVRPGSNEGQPGFSADALNRAEAARIRGLPSTAAPGPASPPAPPTLRAAPPPKPLPSTVPPQSVQQPQVPATMGTEIPPHLKEALLEEAARLTLAAQSARMGAR